MSENSIGQKGKITSEAAPTMRRGRLPGPEIGFGKRLREARGIRKQVDIAKRAQIARSALARYEKGSRFPSVPELRRLCEALAVAPEHLIFGDDSPGFAPSQSAVAAVAPGGDSEKDKIARQMLTGILLNALPKNEGDAFRELIWASVSQHLKDQPEALSALSNICVALVDSLWEEMGSIVGEKLETDPRLRDIMESLSDNDNAGS